MEPNTSTPIAMPPGVTPATSGPAPVTPVVEPTPATPVQTAEQGAVVSSSSKWNALEIGAGVAIGVLFCVMINYYRTKTYTHDDSIKKSEKKIASVETKVNNLAATLKDY